MLNQYVPKGSNSNNQRDAKNSKKAQQKKFNKRPENSEKKYEKPASRHKKSN